MWQDQRMRDSDRHLILAVWSGYGLTLTKQQRAVYMDLPSADIIIRRRREFSKLYPASPLVDNRRYHAFKEVTEEYSNGRWFDKLIRRKGI